MIEIRQVTEPEQALVPPLCELLIDAVHNGASVGFLAPLTIDRAARSNRLALRSIVESVRPRLLVHGHYHYRYNGVHRCDDGYTTEVVGLGRDGQGEDSWVVVDLDLWK